MRWTKAAVLCTSAVVFGSVHPAVADEHDQTESIQDESIQDECTDAEDPPTPTVLEVSEVPIVVDSTTADYFVLYVSHDVDGQSLQIPVAVVLGETGTTTLAENVEALPAERYRVEKYLVADPADVDGDCTDDITELADSVGMNPVNPEAGLGINDGAVAIPDRATYDALAAGQIVKFTIYDIDTNLPGIYFHNTNTYEMHPVVGIQPRRFITGVVSYNSGLAAPDSSTGAYYTFIPGVFSFDFAERVYAVLAAAMPLLDDDLLLHIPNNRLRQFQSQLALFRESRIDLVFDEDIYAGVDFDPLNPGVGYGRLRSLDSDERPHPRDVVIFGTLPNELPRVAGIISAVPQTPLSHVNLRAVQNGVPNAFIRGVLDDPSVTALLDGFVRYGVTGDDGWNLRAATVEEVDAHYASSRPTKMQAPQRDLSVTTITPLSDIGFDDWDAFGVKAANVAVLGKLGFVDGTVPDGFSIPFYFYDEFMKTTGLCARVEAMLADPDFQNDFDTQNDELQKLRTAIKDAQTPAWITAALTEMHNEFPQGTSLRYRSSTNNEDLPGFNGAGLYDSKTQHPDETVEDGIAKSLKQVYASLWNFRAFSERDFHRIDHSTTAMGVLVHPNYSDELANGVAVSFNLVHNLRSSYYVNTQLGEDLVTNPDAFSKPEELLLYWDLGHPNYYVVLGTSNLTPPGQLLMSDEQIRQLRLHLKAIHDHFKGLYAPAGGEPFAMEIEFKITSVDVLAIKQARPWVFASAGSAQSTSTATTDDSSSCDPSAINPGVVDPGVVDPGVVDPGVVDPGVVDPGVVDPGVVDPGVVDPGVVDPGVVDPGVVDPGVVDPGVVDPGVVDPGVVDPGVVDPGVVDPGVVDPGVVDPGVVDPGVVDPGVVDPGVVDPGVVDPGVVDPGVVDPGVVDPGVVDPGVVDGDGVVDPGVVDPGVVDPGVG